MHVSVPLLSHTTTYIHTHIPKHTDMCMYMRITNTYNQKDYVTVKTNLPNTVLNEIIIFRAI